MRVSRKVFDSRPDPIGLLSFNVTVGMKRPSVLLPDRFRNSRQPLVTRKGRDGGIDRGIIRYFPCQVIGVPRSVGGMKVNHDVGIVIVQQFHHRSRFRCIQLDVVAIDVEPLRIGANAHPADGTILRSPIGQRHALIAIGVINWRDE